MSRTILIVEDDKAFADVVRELLVGEGYSVIRIADGISAINMISANHRPPDLIICDIRLPGLRGDRLAHEVRRRFPKLRLPILLLSASSDPHVRLRDVLFMSKPFEMLQLLSTVAHLAALPRSGRAATI